MKKDLKIKHTGFTLLFASLIVSLLLAVGLAILNITLQQILLSSVAKESEFAFYNADTGVECALYYDKTSPNGKIFATSTQTVTQSTPYISSPADISCAGVTAKSVTADPGTFTSSSASTVFELIFPSIECTQTSGPNADKLIQVTVTKTDDGGGNTQTVISSRGYNTCDTANPRRVERGFRTQY